MTKKFVEELKKRLKGMGAEILKTYYECFGRSGYCSAAEIYFKKKGQLDIQMVDLAVIEYGTLIFVAKKGHRTWRFYSVEEALEEIQWIMDSPRFYRE